VASKEEVKNTCCPLNVVNSISVIILSCAFSTVISYVEKKILKVAADPTRDFFSRPKNRVSGNGVKAFTTVGLALSSKLPIVYNVLASRSSMYSSSVANNIYALLLTKVADFTSFPLLIFYSFVNIICTLVPGKM
jgi:hypothetical protein